MNEVIRKRFSVVGFFSAAVATLLFALAAALTIVWTDGFRTAPGLLLSAFVVVSATASCLGWLYFVTGRQVYGWIVASLFAGFGLPIVILGLIESFHPPERHEMVTLEVSNSTFGVAFLFPLILSGCLARELRKK